MSTSVRRLLRTALVILTAWPVHASATTLPAGFADTLVASGLTNPMSMAFAPDGRLFVCQQGGQVRIIKNGALLPTPFLTLNVNAAGEGGLLALAFDPNFAANQYVYVHYTATTPTWHNRVSRFTANGDAAVPGSETILVELNTLVTGYHMGGAMHFGADRKLYIAVGNNEAPGGPWSNSQDFSNFFGKILRINPDGTIPDDNPFGPETDKSAIWALGLRNPFTFAVHPTDGRMFINDVGENTYEEVNDGIAGANYGWADSEGPTDNDGHRGPLYFYGHESGACAITGGAFYRPAVVQFPQAYEDRYFFADYCAGWIHTLDSATGAVATFASGLASPVDVQVGHNGALYYLVRGSSPTAGAVYSIQYTGSEAPSITQHPASQTVPVGQAATFSVTASGTPPLSYQWQRNGGNISGAIAAQYTTAAVTAADNGATFRCIVSNAAGTVISNDATLTVTGNSAPVATITQPAAGTLYTGGMTIAYQGTASDAEDGILPAAVFTWWIDFHHDNHTHPVMQPTSGATGGSFTIPLTGETSTNVWYRLYLMVRDSKGLQATTFRDIRPRIVTLKVTTQRSGLQIIVDDQSFTAPYTFTAVVGMKRTIGAPSSQTLGGGLYIFVSWSDGGAPSHEIVVPTTATTYTARYRKR